MSGSASMPCAGSPRSRAAAQPRRRRVALLASLLLSAPVVAQSTIDSPPSAAEWTALERDYVAFTHRQDPLRAGARGDRAALARWPDDSPQSLRAQHAALQEFRERLGRLPGTAPAGAALSRAVMLRQVDLALESLDLDEARLPFQTSQGFFTVPDTQAAVTTLSGEGDAEAWLRRMAAIPAYFDIETANLARGITTRFTQPALVTRAAIAAVEKAAALPVAESPLLLPFATLPDSIAAGRRAELTARARELIESAVQPAQRKLAAFLRDRYLPAARPGLAISTLPDGARYYAFVVRRETTTLLTPAAIHELGLAELARIHTRMQALTDAAGVRDPRSYAARLNADPKQYPADVADYAGKAAEIAKRIDYLLPRYFGLLPRLTYGIRAKPAALESTSDGYLPGSPATGQAGTVVYSATDVLHAPLYGLPAWLLHEGVPGHHLQIALAEENTRLPEYRRSDDITAFVEGWALYAERLGEDMSVYRNDDERFGRLSMEAWRACRLVIDTGIHAMQWSRDRAIACLKDNTAMTDAAIAYEVDRYIGWPAQALGYKIGEIRIEQMRTKALSSLGPAFDLRRFHDVVLGEGALPMDLLEKRVDEWIEERRRAEPPG